MRIKINENEREVRDADANWINEQINRRRREGVVVCVRVSIESNNVNLLLSTPACTTGRGIARPLSLEEQRILALWEQHHLNSDGFAGGNVVSFLKQIT
jgi:hypothetical protein